MFLNGKVLLAHQKGANNTFLPGGHIEAGESAESALVREVEEEIGRKATVKKFFGAVEHLWSADSQDHHEINLIFEITIPGLERDRPPRSREDHLEFIWTEQKDLKAHNLQPYPLIDCLTNWSPDRGAYWGSSIKDAQ